MASLTHSFKPKLAYIIFVKKRDDFIEKHMPRNCMVVSTALILVGLGIPLLMAVQLLPITWLLAFVGFAIAATGGVMALIFCGEI